MGTSKPLQPSNSDHASLNHSPKLSVAIISHNEEDNISLCIDSVRSLAHEIIVVDSHSTDNTVEIARSLGAKVFSEDWKGFVDQKNSALQKCSGDWILSLDCDEVLSEELAGSVAKALAHPEADGYRVNRKTFFMGRWIEHAWYPDWNLRLVRRGAGRWDGLDLHESMVVDGKIKDLEGDLRHFSFRDLRDFFDRSVRYAATGASSYLRGGKRVGLGQLLLNPLHGFLKHYIIKRGFLDGFPGFIVSVSNGIYIFMKYAFLWELQRAEKGGKE